MPEMSARRRVGRDPGKRDRRRFTREQGLRGIIPTAASDEVDGIVQREILNVPLEVPCGPLDVLNRP